MYISLHKKALLALLLTTASFTHAIEQESTQYQQEKTAQDIVDTQPAPIEVVFTSPLPTRIVVGLLGTTSVLYNGYLLGKVLRSMGVEGRDAYEIKADRIFGIGSLCALLVSLYALGRVTEVVTTTIHMENVAPENPVDWSQS